MPDLFIYLLKANVALSLFYLAYRLGLRRLTFYTLNRFFLLTGIVFSSVFPLVDVNDFFHRNESALETVVYYVPDFNALRPAPEAAEFTVWTFLTYVFWAGVAVMTIRLLFQLLSLLVFHMTSKEAKVRNSKVRIVKREMAPFSFFKNIYLNPSLHSGEELEAVISHEQIHVKEWHSADVMMGEVNNVFYWFNPGAWLMKTAIRENLEFITDRRMLRAGVDAKVYQYSLLKVSGAPYATAIANNFNFSHLKNRIMMMNKERSSRYQVVRYLVLGCMVSVLVLTLNFSRAGVKLAPVGQGTIPQLFVEKTDTLPQVKVENIKKPLEEVVVTGKADTTKKPRKTITIELNDSTGNPKPLQLMLQEVQQKAGKVDTTYLKAQLTFLATASQLEPVEFKSRLDEVVVTGYGTAQTGTAKSLESKPLQEVTVTGYGNRQASGVRPRTVQGQVIGISSSVAPPSRLTGTYAFSSKPGQDVVFVGAGNNAGRPVSVTRLAGKDYEYVLDGKPSSEKEVGALSSDRLKSVTLKTENQKGYVYVETKQAGDQTPVNLIYRSGQNGFSGGADDHSRSLFVFTPDSVRTVVGRNIRFTGHVDSTRQPLRITSRGTSGLHDVLYVVDGKMSDSNVLQRIDANSIESISVLKDQSAASLYGPRGNHGVIIITTKKGGELKKVAAADSEKESLAKFAAARNTSNKALRVYPNPSSDGRYTVDYPGSKSGKAEMKVFNSNGEVVYSEKSNGSGVAARSLVDLSKSPAGTYYVKVLVDGKTYTKKIIRQ